MFGRFHSYTLCNLDYHVCTERTGFFSNAFDLCPVCVCSDILKKAMSGRGQFPDVDTVLFRVRTGAKSDKPSFGAVFHGIKNIIIVEFSFKLNLISGRINGFFTKHIKISARA